MQCGITSSHLTKIMPAREVLVVVDLERDRVFARVAGERRVLVAQQQHAYATTFAVQRWIWTVKSNIPRGHLFVNRIAKKRDEHHHRRHDPKQVDDDQVRDREQPLDEDLPARQPLRVLDVEADRVVRRRRWLRRLSRCFHHHVLPVPGSTTVRRRSQPTRARSRPIRGRRQASTIAIRCMIVGWVPKSSVRPARRVGVARGSSSPRFRQRAARGGGIAGGLERDPVGLGLEPARERVLERRRGDREQRRITSSASGIASGRYMPPRRRVAARDQEGRRHREQRRTSRSSSRCGRANGGRARARARIAPRRGRSASEQRVPEDHAPRRAEAGRGGVGLGRELLRLLHLDVGISGQALLALACDGHRPSSRLSRSGSTSGIRNGETNANSSPMADEGRQPPAATSCCRADGLRAPSRSGSSRQTNEEDAAEREPAAHDPLEIAELGDVVAASHHSCARPNGS